MDIHEYQAKELLVEVRRADPARRPRLQPRAGDLSRQRDRRQPWVVKAQIHSGARGKAGGVKLCRNDDEIERGRRGHARQASSSRTRPAPRGKLVSRLYIEEATDIAKEIYLGFVHGPRVRAHHGRRLARRRHGDRGDLGQAARHHHPRRGRPGRRHAGSSRRARSPSASASSREIVNKLVPTIMGCYRAFRDLDATMVEINPLVITKDKARRRARRQDVASTTTPCSAARRSPSCATRARKTRARPTPPTAASPTSASTATSAASSTAPASRWPRWT